MPFFSFTSFVQIPPFHSLVYYSLDHCLIFFLITNPVCTVHFTQSCKVGGHRMATVLVCTKAWPEELDMISRTSKGLLLLNALASNWHQSTFWKIKHRKKAYDPNLPPTSNCQAATKYVNKWKCQQIYVTNSTWQDLHVPKALLAVCHPIKNKQTLILKKYL